MSEAEQKPLFDADEAQPSWTEHWRGMPEYIQHRQEPYCKLIVRFRSQADLDEFARRIGQRLNVNSQCTWFPEWEFGKDAGMRYVDES